MKNNEVVTSQGGLVTFYGNEIDVKTGVKTVKIIKNLMMYDTNKCFPDVVELNIVNYSAPFRGGVVDLIKILYLRDRPARKRRLFVCCRISTY